MSSAMDTKERAKAIRAWVKVHDALSRLAVAAGAVDDAKLHAIINGAVDHIQSKLAETIGIDVAGDR